VQDRETEAFIRSLCDTDDWREQMAAVEGWIADARWPRLARVHRRLVELTADGANPAFRSIEEHIERSVALSPGEGAAKVAWDLFRVALAGRSRTRIPAMLAQAQPWERLRGLIEGTPREGAVALEAAALLVLEAGLREPRVDEDPVAREVWAGLARAGHPLAWLPLARQPLESEVALIQYGPRAWSRPSSTPARGPAPLGSGLVTDGLAPEPLAPAEQRALEGAFASMLSESNGRVACARFRAPEPLAPSLGLLRAIAASFGPLRDASELRGGEISAAAAVASLLAAAMHGGAYDHGLGHCYGRLAGWKALGAVVGAHAQAAFDEVAEAVRSAAWLSVEPSTAWFEGVAWDGCIAALHRSRTSLTLLAWTDTD